MSHDHSTAVIEHYLIELEGDSPAELLGTVAERLLKALREARPLGSASVVRPGQPAHALGAQ
jgi:hypothetical protein